MAQLSLFPDARPLEERLGRDFFRQAPRRPGVYLMRDAQDKIVYVGKAKDLRQRLGDYRVANPDRMARRHLRMVNEVDRIEFQFCPTEAAALKQEQHLIRSLKPKFNRAGVWPGRPKFIVWRLAGPQLEIAIAETPAAGWQRFGPIGGWAAALQPSLLRLLWLALNPDRPVTELPAGWTRGATMGNAALTVREQGTETLTALAGFFWQVAEDFLQWLETRLSGRANPFERNLIAMEMDVLREFGARPKPVPQQRQQLALL